MSSHILTGKPGGGKGYVAVEQFIIPEIVHGERVVVTSLDVKVLPWVRVSRSYGKTSYKPELGMQAYLQRVHKKDFDVTTRVFRISDEQALEYYLYRVRNGKLTTLAAERDDKGRVVSYDTSDPGPPILFVIDEAPMLFGSRDWANTSKGLLFYNRQHRKTNDEIVYCAQHTKDLESALQRVAQDFINCTNRAKVSFKFFTQPSVIQVDTYSVPPIGPSVKPQKTRFLKLDKAGLGACFDTSSGVGMSSAGAADINEKKKGIPWWLIPIALGLIAVVLAKGTDYLGSFVAGMGSSKKKAVPQVHAVSSLSSEQATVASDVVPRSVVMAEAIPSRVTCCGYARFSYSRTDAILSDGRVVTQPELQAVSKAGVTVSGVFYPMARPGTSPTLGPEQRSSDGSGVMSPVSVPRLAERDPASLFDR